MNQILILSSILFTSFFAISNSENPKSIKNQSPAKQEFNIEQSFVGKKTSTNRREKRKLAQRAAVNLRDKGFLIIVLNTYDVELNLPNLKDKTREKIIEAKELQKQIIIENYSFSEFVVCYDTNLPKILKGEYEGHLIFESPAIEGSGIYPKTLMIARVGDFWYESNQSMRAGFFFYNRNMKLMEKPFPFFVPFRSSRTYLHSKTALSSLVTRVNLELAKIAG